LPPDLVRAEREGDRAAVYALNVAAFGGTSEANLVDALRAQAQPLVSLVAEEDGKVVGHILFSPVVFESRPFLRIMGLAPMAVAPERQRIGIGAALVRAGLRSCRALGVDAVVVLGHPGYYPRFGFAPSTQFGFKSEYDVPDEVFMALELVQNCLKGASGTARYHEAFAAAE
jgi:putative acetyltransferase